MPPGFFRLLIAWLALILLWGLEFGLTFVHMPPSVRPVILGVTAVMLTFIAFFFMHLSKGPIIIRGFAVIGLFWMIVLIGLGSIDPLTRVQYFTTIDHP